MSDEHPTAAPGDPQPGGTAPGPSPYGPDAGQPDAYPAAPSADPYPGQPYTDPYAAAPYGDPSAAAPYAGTSAEQPYPAQQPEAYPAGYAAPGYAVAPYAAPGYASAYPVAYGVDPLTGLAWSDKSKTTAGLLQLLLPLVGVCGVGRLYAGQIGIGLAQLLGFFLGCVLMVVLIGFVVAPAVWLWAVVDGIVLLTTGGRDQYGRLLR
ncbi:TM2 domain-containing protein [Cellulosimicrobium cellulans]|uniref:TM2 domain-containing protein n=1 Tax=Cellulosimicrobium cellulans TaxID=1710 RepID=UPI00130E9D9C|nr:TM2 domain-containing protein [Cellulosimicrobium cellulans]